MNANPNILHHYRSCYSKHLSKCIQQFIEATKHTEQWLLRSMEFHGTPKVIDLRAPNSETSPRRESSSRIWKAPIIELGMPLMFAFSLCWCLSLSCYQIRGVIFVSCRSGLLSRIVSCATGSWKSGILSTGCIILTGSSKSGGSNNFKLLKLITLCIPSCGGGPIYKHFLPLFIELYKAHI